MPRAQGRECRVDLDRVVTPGREQRVQHQPARPRHPQHVAVDFPVEQPQRLDAPQPLLRQQAERAVVQLDHARLEHPSPRRNWSVTTATRDSHFGGAGAGGRSRVDGRAAADSAFDPAQVEVLAPPLAQRLAERGSQRDHERAGPAAGARGSGVPGAFPYHPARAVANLPPARDPVNRVAATHTPARLA